MPSPESAARSRTARWAVVEDSRAPARHVAACTLRTRLEAVWGQLEAACGPRHDPDAVHQLRVATRRTLAAITAFDALLPRKQRRWFEKRLQRIRRAAGEARDLDVLTDRLAREERIIDSPAAARRARRRLVAMLSRQRDVSRGPIRAIREELASADWSGRVERLLERIASGASRQTFARYARRRFEPLLKRFFARADRRLRDAEEIHELRIEGKKLRYALEIFAVVFPKGTRAKCEKSLARLQESLGEFTDHAAAADRLRRWSRKDGATAERDTIADLRAIESERADAARRTFAKWWNPDRRRALRRRFARTLRRGSA